MFIMPAARSDCLRWALRCLRTYHNVRLRGLLGPALASRRSRRLVNMLLAEVDFAVVAVNRNHVTGF
jgi:hypothetical protein